MRRLIWVLSALSAVAACSRPFWNAPERKWRPAPLDSTRAAAIADPEYSVYAFVAHEVLDRKHPGPALFYDSTDSVSAGGHFSPPALREGQESFGDAVADLLRKAQAPQPLVDRFDGQLWAAFVGDSLFSPQTTRAAWVEVYRTYPKAGPVLRVSRVGFNADTTRAVLWVDISCAPILCGNGGYWFLARAPGKQWVLWDRRILVYS